MSERYIKKWAQYTLLMKLSFFLNGLTIFCFCAEVLQYIIPSRGYYFWVTQFDCLNNVRIILHLQIITLGTSLLSYVFNMLNHVERNGTRYEVVIITSMVVFVFRLIWNVCIHDYTNLILMNHDSIP